MPGHSHSFSLKGWEQPSLVNSQALSGWGGEPENEARLRVCMCKLGTIPVSAGTVKSIQERCFIYAPALLVLYMVSHDTVIR